LVPIKNENNEIVKYEWKVDLLKSKVHWIGLIFLYLFLLIFGSLDWFKGLTEAFLSIRIPKLLLLAEKDRMDKELMIAQMQGKFKMVVLFHVGHVMQEDDAPNTALNIYLMITQFKIPMNLAEIEECAKIGIGKFHPNIKKI
jgi:protein phosphatase methylesterase 1